MDKIACNISRFMPFIIYIKVVFLMHLPCISFLINTSVRIVLFMLTAYLLPKN